MSSEKNKALNSILKGASIIFIGVVISKLLGLLFRVLVGRTLGPTEYGIIALLIAVFSAAETFGHMGINRGVQRYISFYRGEEDLVKMVGTARSGYLLILLPSIIVGALLFVFAPWLSVEIFDEERLITPLQMAAVAIPFWGVAKVSVAVTNAFEKMQYKVYINKIWTNSSEVFLAFLLIYLGYGYIGASFAYVFGFATASVLGLYYVQKVFPEVFSYGDSDKNYSQLWQHSWPLFAAGVFGIITGHIDTFMIQYFIGAEQVGIYQAAYPFAILLLAGNSMFSKIFLSRASYLTSKSQEDLTATFRVIVKWVTLVTLPVFLLLLAYPRSVLVLFGAEYYAAENVLRILLVGFMIHAVMEPAKDVFQAVDRTKLITGLSVIVAGLNFGLNIFLIPLYGITGAALASTATFIVVFGVKALFIHRILGVQPFRTSIFRIMAAGIAGIGLIVLIANSLFVSTPYWFLIPGFIGFGLVYSVLTVLFGSFEEEDITILHTVDEKTVFNLKSVIKIVEKYSR